MIVSVIFICYTIAVYRSVIQKGMIKFMKKNITFDDIARFTGFSKTTVSRYFNKPDSLTAENQKIISDALVKLNYQENKVARILANGKTEFIGIIIPNLYLHYYSEILNRILLSYEKYGYKFLVFLGNNDEETERRYIQELLAYKIEGLIILSHTISSRELADLHIPVVAIEREDQFISSVNTDNYAGTLQAMKLLDEHSCEIMLHINNPTLETTPAYGRIQGFQDYCREHQLDSEMFVQDLGNNYEETQAELQKILTVIEEKYKEKRKGIFVSNDTYANILLNLLIRKYGCFPEDYYLVGFDNSPVSQQAVFPISTIGQQIDCIAREAMKILVEQMDSQKKRIPAPLSEPVHKTIEPILFRRETTEKNKYFISSTN